MSDPRGLPKFGSGKNPFRSTAKSGQPIESVSSSQPTPPLETPQQQETVGARTAPVRRSQESPTTSALLPERCQPSGAARAGTVRAPDQRPVGWWEKLAALVPGSRRGSKPTKATRALKPAVQCELSLEKIQVMRNDLSDTDLEVIPAKKPGPIKNVAVQPPANISASDQGGKLFHEADANMVGRS